MNRRKLHFYVSVFGVSAAGLAVACGSLSPYPAPDPIGDYPAGFQHPGGGSAGPGGGGDSGLPCYTTEAGTVCPEGGLPDAMTPPPCTGCIEIAAAQNPQSVALDKTSIYWTEGIGDPWGGIPPVGSTDSIKKAGRGGAASPPVSVVSGLMGPFILKEASGWLAWSDLAGLGAGMSSVDSFMTTATGSPKTPGAGLHNEHGVALDATNVYWVSSDMAAVDAVVQSAPLAGGAVSTLGMTSTGAGFLPLGVAASSSMLYFVGYEPAGNGGLFSIPIKGGVPTEMWMASAAGNHPTDVTVDSSSVYWTDTGTGIVYSMPLGGGAVATVASGMMSPRSIAVDSTNVYFTATDGIYEAPIASGAPKLIAPVLNTLGIAADNTDAFVYFTSASAIVAIAK